MPSRVEGYRQRAEQCRKWAEKARDPDAKRTFEELAAQWAMLAEEVDRNRI